MMFLSPFCPMTPTIPIYYLFICNSSRRFKRPQTSAGYESSSKPWEVFVMNEKKSEREKRSMEKRARMREECDEVAEERGYNKRSEPDWNCTLRARWIRAKLTSLITPSHNEEENVVNCDNLSYLRIEVYDKSGGGGGHGVEIQDSSSV